MKRLFITYLLACGALISSAQVKVESSISSIEMLVGQQVQLTVSATADENAVVEFPQTAIFPQGIEFLGAIDMPNLSLDDGQVTRQRGYVLTSFDDTLYYLPPLEVRVDGKTYQTKKLALKVLTVDVDTTNYEQYCYFFNGWPKEYYFEKAFDLGFGQNIETRYIEWISRNWNIYVREDESTENKDI